MTQPVQRRTSGAGTYVRSSPFEIATCWLHGLLPPMPLPRTSCSPREALDDAIRPSLLDGPCYVAFSGGRDSSAVLAAATDLARREGLADPIPVTRVYPDLPESDETSWQHLVLDHLGLRDWLRLEFRSGETDLLGETAQAGLRSRGLVWPPALQVQATVYEQLGGGSLLTGEGGDETLGARRVTPLTLLRRRRRPTRALVSWAARSVAPRPVREVAIRAELRDADLQGWLRPAVRAQHHRLMAADAAAEPLSYSAGLWSVTRHRTWAALRHNQGLAAAEFGLHASDPLLDHGFLAALAHVGHRWGFNGRTATMKALFSDVLPPAVLSRTTKAQFNQAYSGPASRAFATSWDGTGVDTELVDPDALRAVWLSDEPTMSSALLLHSAWLATVAP